MKQKYARPVKPRSRGELDRAIKEGRLVELVIDRRKTVALPLPTTTDNDVFIQRQGSKRKGYVVRGYLARKEDHAYGDNGMSVTTINSSYEKPEGVYFDVMKRKLERAGGWARE